MPRTSIDRIIPLAHVIATARQFLVEANWRLEFDGVVCEIPTDVELRVASRAFVAEDIEGTWGNHYLAKVLIGPESPSGHIVACGILTIYFDEQGRMLSEDRSRY